MHRLFAYIGVRQEDHQVIGTMYLAFFTSGMVNIITGLLIPYLTAEHGIQLVQSGIMLSTHEAGNLVAVLLAGFLSLHIGKKPTALLLTSGLLVAMPLVLFVRDFAWLTVAYAGAGIARGAIGNLCNSVVADKSENKVAALNVLHALFAVGALLLPVVMVALTHRQAAFWRGGVLLIAILGLILWGNLWIAKLPNHRQPRTGKAERTFFSRRFWVTTGILFFYISAESTIIGWFVMYFETVGILSAAIAKLVPVLLWGMILVGRMGCAYMSKTTSSSKLLIMIGLVFSGFFALLLAAQTTALCIVALLGIGLSMAGIYPTTISTLKQATTASTGACIAIASTGGVIMPGIVGYVGNLLGMACGMAAVLVALGGMVFCMGVHLWMDKAVDPFHGAGENK